MMDVAFACSRIVVVLKIVESDVVRALVTSDKVSVTYKVVLFVCIEVVKAVATSEAVSNRVMVD